MLDDVQRVVLLNPTAGELLGIDAVQVLNQPVDCLFGERSRSPDFLKHLQLGLQ